MWRILFFGNALPDSNFDSERDPWPTMIAQMSPNIADKLKNTTLIALENGKATIGARQRVDWLNNRLAGAVARELKLSGYAVEEVVFVTP